MIEKQFKNLDEQIEIFKHKGLVIHDEDYAKQVLLRENYFFLNGYRHLFYKSETEKEFIKGAEMCTGLAVCTLRTFFSGNFYF